MNGEGFNDGLTAADVASAIMELREKEEDSYDDPEDVKAIEAIEKKSRTQSRSLWREIEDKLDAMAVDQDDGLHGVYIHELPRHSQERTKAAQKNARRSSFGEFTTKG